jgi:hypothetical protein
VPQRGGVELARDGQLVLFLERPYAHAGVRTDQSVRLAHGIKQLREPLLRRLDCA